MSQQLYIKSTLMFLQPSASRCHWEGHWWRCQGQGRWTWSHRHTQPAEQDPN